MNTESCHSERSEESKDQILRYAQDDILNYYHEYSTVSRIRFRGAVTRGNSK